MLPTDARFQDLTEEQINLIWEHYKLDNNEASRPTPAAHDPDYEKDTGIVGDGKFVDPDFDAAWDADDAGSGQIPSVIIPQNPPKIELREEDEGANVPSIHDKDEWEEV